MRKAADDGPEWDRDENFAKVFHVLWDLGLIQKFLKRPEEIFVLLSMLRYAGFHSGECVVFISVLMRESGLKWPNQVQRTQAKIEKMGAFRRAPGRNGFKNVYGKSVELYHRCTGKEILEHARRNGLISEEKRQEIALKEAQNELEAEARAEENGSQDPPETAGGHQTTKEAIRTLDEHGIYPDIDETLDQLEDEDVPF